MSVLKKNGFAIIVLILSIVMMVGASTVFRACAPMEDGSWMSCHWAQKAVMAMGNLIFSLSVLRLAIPERVGARLGLSVACILSAITAAYIPGNVIDLCMMDTMRCHTQMQPATLVLSVLVSFCAVGDMVVTYLGMRKGKKA